MPFIKLGYEQMLEFQIDSEPKIIKGWWAEGEIGPSSKHPKGTVFWVQLN